MTHIVAFHMVSQVPRPLWRQILRQLDFMWHRNQKNFWSTVSTGLPTKMETPFHLAKLSPTVNLQKNVHPRCNCDAKRTKPDCPFTCMSRIPVLSQKPAVTTLAPPSCSQLCHYCPACKKIWNVPLSSKTLQI